MKPRAALQLVTMGAQLAIGKLVLAVAGLGLPRAERPKRLTAAEDAALDRQAALIAEAIYKAVQQHRARQHRARESEQLEALELPVETVELLGHGLRASLLLMPGDGAPLAHPTGMQAAPAAPMSDSECVAAVRKGRSVKYGRRRGEW